jgi:hypothetical protein
MPKWLWSIRSITEIAGFSQTWVAIVTGAGTAWGAIAAWYVGLPADQIAIRALYAFALSAAGAFFATKVVDWTRYEIGPAKRVREVRRTLTGLVQRKHQDIGLRDLADLWSGKRQIGPAQDWAEWNNRLRDLKDAANDDQLKLTRHADGSIRVDTSRVDLNSAIEFFQSPAWKAYFRR